VAIRSLITQHARTADLFTIPAAAAAAVAPAAVPKVAAWPNQGSLSVTGVFGRHIASDEEGFGIFLDQSTKAVFRLRVGEDYQGWKLRSVQGRKRSWKGSTRLSLSVAAARAGTDGH